MLHHLIAFLFPPICVGCETVGSILCKSCTRHLIPHAPVCPVCHRISQDFRVCLRCKSPFERGIIGFQYGTLIQTLIKQVKYHHATRLITVLAYHLALHIASHPDRPTIQSDCLITTVPMHRYKQYRLRGHNHAELLAQAVAHILHVPYIPLLRKTRWTFSQAGKKKQAREHRLEKSFCHIPMCIPQQHLLLIDDVVTTGSTLHQVGSILKQAYPQKNIYSAVLARNS